MFQQFDLYNGYLEDIPSTKQLITTLNAHSFNTLKRDIVFCKALQESDVLLPDGISVVFATQFLKKENIKKIAGDDLFRYEMQRVYGIGGKCFFLGSSEKTLHLIKEKAEKEYPGLQVHTYSPPYKAYFSEKENRDMINAVNLVQPDVLFVGMTAPKQEKWAYQHFRQLNAGHVCCIGAVFDFYAGTVKRAPQWVINIGMEWCYRLLSEPRRMWKRYLIGNTRFVAAIMKERFTNSSKKTNSTSLQSQTITTKQD